MLTIYITGLPTPLPTYAQDAVPVLQKHDNNNNNVPHKGKTQEEDPEEEAQVKNTSSPHLIVLLDGKGVEIVSAQAPVLAGEVHHGGIPLQKKSHCEFR